MITSAFAALPFLAWSACGSPSGGFSGGSSGSGADDSGSSVADATSGASGSASSGSGSGSGSGSSGGTPKRDAGAIKDGASGAGQRVDSGILFTDAGVPYCNASTPCDLTQNTCCVSTFGSGTCQTGHGGSCNGGAFECLEKSDCPGSEICCGYESKSAMTAGSKCQDVSTTGGKCSPSGSTAQLCQTVGECPSGVTCIPQSCNVGAAINANLTMCGLQMNSSYNCTAR